MNKRHIHVLSQTIGSIGEITNDLVLGLKDQFHVTQERLGEIPKEFDILLSHFIHPSLSKDENFKKFKYKVLIQPIDGTDMTKVIVKELNKYDLIITPAQAGLNIMKKNGVKTRIVVIPNYFKPEHLNLPENVKIKGIPEGKIVLYHESTFHSRKGIEILYESYVKAFSDTLYADKVVLVLKDMPFNDLTFNRIEKLKENTIKLQRRYSNPAQIVKISQYCNWETLQKLWSIADIYVSFAKIEGFGIPLLRMAALKKPIISLNNPNSGYVDYLTLDNSYLVPVKQKKAEDEHMNIYKPTTLWGIPTISDTVKTLKQAVEDYVEGKEKIVSKETLENMSYENVLKKYTSVLNSL